MILENNAKGQKYYHHNDFHHDHDTHAETGVPEISVKQSGTREIKVVRRVLDVNEKMADENRRIFADHDVFVVNVMSSPGSGKTTTLEKTLAKIMPEYKGGKGIDAIGVKRFKNRLNINAL